MRHYLHLIDVKHWFQVIFKNSFRRSLFYRYKIFSESYPILSYKQISTLCFVTKPGSTARPLWLDYHRLFKTGCIDLLKINVWTGCFKWRPILLQMWESTYRQTLFVRVASVKHKIQTSDWPKWCYERYVISRLLSEQTSFQMVRQRGCRYFNCDSSF